MMGVTKLSFIGSLEHKDFLCNNFFDPHSNPMGWLDEQTQPQIHVELA